ncbi:serine protease [Pleurocapsales cyanobacterium LEGE 06147]|nr:serine protease [Pleurocapsales cyanobacterium LEGE 06147]
MIYRARLSFFGSWLSKTVTVVARGSLLTVAVSIAAPLAIAFPTMVAAKSDGEIARTAEPVTVQINSNTASPGGSGVIIAKDDNTYTVLTANHVVCDTIPRPGPIACRQDITYTVRTYTGKEYPLGLVEYLQKNENDPDLAVVTFQSPQEYPVAQLGDSDRAAIASDIYVAGFPATFGKIGPQRDFTLTKGAVASRSNAAIKGYGLVYDARTKTGMSGGPVLDIEGRLIGIHGLGDSSNPQTGDPSVPQKSGFNAAIPIDTFKQLCPQIERCPQLAENTVSPNEQAATDLNNPNSARDYYKKGLSLQAKGNYRAAIDNYTQALQLTPDNSTALSTYLNRGYAYLNLSNWQAAIDDYNRALQIDPNDARAYSERGDARRELGDIQGAIADYTRAINLDPSLAYAYNNRAFVLNRQGDLNGAEADLKKAAELLLAQGQMTQYQVVMSNLKTVERNHSRQPTQPSQPATIDPDPNWTMIKNWGLNPASCNEQAVSILIDGKEYCTQPADWLSLGKYKYIRNEDRLEPISQASQQPEPEPEPNSSNTQALAVAPKFTFTSVWEYGNCLEDILQLSLGPEQLRQRGRMSNCLADVFQVYGNTGLSQSQALELIRAADVYATSQLNPSLYPPQGQRARIAKMFGFTYQIDKAP